MQKYINAEKLEKDGWSASRTYPQDTHTMVYETKKMTDFPTADVRENVHAHWDKVEMKRGEWWHTCSKCKATWGSEDGELDFNFCPNCGAQMEANDGEITKRID